MPVKDVVGPGLSPLSSVLPVASVTLEAASVLGIPNTPEALTADHWTAAITRIEESSDDAAIGIAYSGAARAGLAPPFALRCRVGQGHDLRPTESVTAVDEVEFAGVLTQTGQPFVRVPHAVDREVLVENWSLQDADAAVRSEIVAIPDGEGEALADAFRLLRRRLDAQQRLVVIQPCSELRIDRFTDSGRVSENRRFVLTPETMFHRSDVSRAELLREISDKLGLALDDLEIERILRNLEEQKVQNLRKAIRKATSDADRLVLAVGAEELRARLPQAVIQAVETREGPLDDRGLGELALVVHGPNVLQEHKDGLGRRVLNRPPNGPGAGLP